jgi:hypothetical protein
MNNYILFFPVKNPFAKQNAIGWLIEIKHCIKSSFYLLCYKTTDIKIDKFELKATAGTPATELPAKEFFQLILSLKV